jgi:teichuronic acid biosynthesis glycosyltransferase TuaC
MRALIVTNMYPTPERPTLGRFVYDQVQALRQIPDVELEVFSFPGGSPASYAGAAVDLRRRFGRRRFDVVHAHFGLTAWPAFAVRAGARAVTLHGTDLAHPRSRPITLGALPWLDLIGAVSSELAGEIPRWAARAPVEVLPTGVDLARFQPINRRHAREEIGVDPAERCLLFPADPERPEKRYDLARLVAGERRLLTLGGVDPERVPLYVNAADAVLVTSDREGFGLATLEALACGVPVLSTPHGVAPEALAGVSGTLCEPFREREWRQALERILTDPDPRVSGRESAARYSSVAMAERVAAAWRTLAAR